MGASWTSDRDRDAPLGAAVSERGDRNPEPLSQRLPPRQRQALELLSRGFTNKEIGRELGISPATAKIHVAHLVAWLGAVNRTDAVARAKTWRLI